MNYRSNLQAIHANNRTHSTRDGHVTIPVFESLPEIVFNPELPFNRYENLTPGPYKVQIGDRYYGFILHQNLTKGDELIIKNSSNMFSIDSLEKHKIIPYKLNNDLNLTRYGYLLQKIAKSPLDVVGFDGKSVYVDPTEVSEGSVTHMSIANIKYTSDDGYQEDKSIHLKARLCSLSPKIYDEVYLDSYLNKTLFIFKVGIFDLTQDHPLDIIESMCTKKYKVLYYKSLSLKPNSDIWCSKVKKMTWKDMNDPMMERNGICSGPKGKEGIWLKLDDAQIRYLHSFQSTIKPFIVIYTLNSPVYKSIPLTNWSALQPPSKDSHILITPYEAKNKLDRIYNIYTGRIDAIKETDLSFLYDIIPQYTQTLPNSPNNPDMYSGRVDAALPINNVIGSSIDQKSEDSIHILNNNRIWYDILMSANMSMKSLFFYRHLLV